MPRPRHPLRQTRLNLLVAIALSGPLGVAAQVAPSPPSNAEKTQPAAKPAPHPRHAHPRRRTVPERDDVFVARSVPEPRHASGKAKP